MSAVRWAPKPGCVFPVMSAACCLALMTSGCISSSVRFTRDYQSSQVITSRVGTVRAGWDYRKSYSMPRERVTRVSEGYLGVRYRWGGMSRKGTDCSGLVCMVYFDVAKVKLPHSSRKLRAIARSIPFGQAKTGDLIFFRGGIFGSVNHVGIYLYKGEFIHASTRKGVIKSNMHEAYYKQRFAGIGRIFK